MKGPYRKDFESITSDMQRGSTWYRTDDGAERRVPLPYSMRQYTVSHSGGTPNQADWNQRLRARCINAIEHRMVPEFERAEIIARNKTYSKMVDAIRSGSLQLGADIAERRKTLATAVQLLNMARSPIKTFAQQANKYFRNNGYTKKRVVGASGKSRAYYQQNATFAPSTALSQLSNAWLTFNWGVKPVIQSIYDLLALLSAPVKPSKLKVSSSDRGQLKTEWIPIYWDNFAKKTTIQYRVGVCQGALVEITNPNLNFLAELGLANPAAVAWETMPFSWLLDYVWNIGDLLDSMTDLLGVELSETYVTTLREYSTNDLLVRRWYNNNQWNEEHIGGAVSTGVQMTRVLNRVVTPKLVFKPKLTITRAANIAAVAFNPLQQMASKFQMQKRRR